MKKILITLLILLSLNTSATPIWQREIINYSREQYKASFQNWMVAQADNGWIYIANSSGLLEFDGVKWTLHQMEKRMTRSVKVVGDRIYVGGSSIFGYFEYDDTGFLAYTSLSDKVKPWRGEVWNILEVNHIIYYISDNYIHVYDPDENRTMAINCDAKINSSTVFDQQIFLGTSIGVMQLTKESKIEPIASTESIVPHKIVELVPYEKTLLIVTARGGIYSFEHNQLTKLKSEADSFISTNQLFSAAIIDSRLILGSVQNGAFIVDLTQNTSSEQINIKNGIINNTILNIFIDRSDNLWLALDKGVSYIDLNSPIQPLFANTSPIGTGYCSMLYNGKLYLGTNQGVYIFSEKGECTLLSGTEGQIWSMNIIDNKLFCSGDNHVIVITPTERYNLNINGIWEVHPLKEDKTKIVAVTYRGFSVLEKRNNRWVFSHEIDGTFSAMVGMLEDDSEPYSFWYIKNESTPTKITLDLTLTSITREKQYQTSPRPLPNNKYFRRVDNNITIATSKGIYVYSRLTDSFEQYTQLESMLAGSSSYNHLSTDRLGDIWYSSDKTMKHLSYHGGGYSSQPATIGDFIDQLTDNHQNVYRVDAKNAIIATVNGFSKIDLNPDTTNIYPMQTHIRNITSTQLDSIVGYGNSRSPIKIPYEDNSIRIEYSATVFTNNADIKYSYRLRDKDLDWSNLSANTSKEYTHLFEGSYTFEVVAVDPITGRYSDVATIQFEILPPWYRSTYAFILYSILFCALLYLLYWMTIAKQKKIINKQREENVIKDQEIDELQNKNLKDELNYKTQELSGYILNVIRKNEILEDVKKRAMRISKSIDDEEPRHTVKQKVTRMIGQIDDNIEKDKEFEIFQSNFNIIHQDFFKLLDEKDLSLSRNDKILCAYLNMNLSSKEIAPLLNISVRGVEVSRYRLRKKMGLSRDVNLIDFLQNL